MTLEAFSEISVWLVNAIYCFGIIPQVILNYRLKSASGLSDLMILGSVLGYITFCYHIFFSKTDFPIAYKVMVPLGLIAVLIILGQRVYYNRIKMKSLYLFAYFSILILSILFIPVGVVYPDMISKACGWIYFSVWLVYMIPQGIKIYLEKSVQGFSFAFATIMTTGVLLELISAIVLGLSLPVIFNALRGILVYIIFCVFFYLYRDV